MGNKRDSESEIVTVRNTDSPISDVVDQMSKHRSCWQHMSVYLYNHKMKMPAQQFRRIQFTSPCFFDTFPHRSRSKKRRRIINQIHEYIPKLIQVNKKLDTGEFDRYFEYLWSSFSEDKKTAFTYLDNLWFSLYMKDSLKGKVLNWVKKKQIFLKRYVLVPIACWSHWSLLILCHLGESFQSKSRTPCMLLLDSLESAGPRRIEPDIRKFMLDIYIAEGRTEDTEFLRKIPLLVPKVPQQKNDFDCGNYVLYFIKLFVQYAPENFTPEGYPYFMKQNWFTRESVNQFCQQLKSILK